MSRVDFWRRPGKSDTPAAWAAAWTLQNPTFIGEVRVEHLVRRGRGGRLGWATRTATFYASGGNAAPRKEIKPGKHYPAHTSPFINGMCERCGKLYRNCVLRRGWRLDRDHLELSGWLWACPACYVALGLTECQQFGVAEYHSRLALHHPRELTVAILNVTGLEPEVTMLSAGSATADRGIVGKSSALVTA